MADPLSSTWDLVGERLVRLHTLLTDEAVDVVTERYRQWKLETRAALAGFLPDDVLGEFDRIKGAERGGSGQRPTPAVYLDAAAARTFLTSIRTGLEAQIPAGRVTLLRVMELLERRLGDAFRGIPQTNGELQDGFETLLAGAGVDYARGQSPLPAFTFKDPSTALELKLCHGPGQEATIAASIRDDAVAWRGRYAHVVFGVCDPGFIRDSQSLSAMFEAQSSVEVRVIALSPGH